MCILYTFSPDYQDYLSWLPKAAHPFLEKELDWDHDGIDKDLIIISESMGIDWEVTLAVPLEFTQPEIDDLKEQHKYQNPVLLR